MDECQSAEDRSPMAGVQVLSGQAIQHVPVLSISVKVANTACNLGIYIDRPCRRCLPHCLLSTPTALLLITRSLSVDAAKSLVQAFITCRPDYWNSLFSGITDSLFQRLQSRSKCGSSTHNWHQPMRPHHTSVERTPLVTSSTARRVQISRVHLSMDSWCHI